MPSYRKQINEALRVTAICSDTEFAWFGRREGHLPSQVRKSIDGETARSYLVTRLQQRLYKSFYCCGSPRSEHRDRDPSAAGGNPVFVDKLSHANRGQGGFIGDWTIEDISGTEVIVHRHGLTISAPRDQCSLPTHEPIAAGAPIAVRFPKEQLGISPGYYMALGDADFDEDPNVPKIRIYWHVTPKGAVPLTSELTSHLNESKVPFRFKILNDPEQFIRCDAAVLYLRRTDCERAYFAIREAHGAVACWLRPGIPAFTKELAPGIGLAEDPQDGGSFGWNRCQLLSEGILSAHELGARSIRERGDVVGRHFAEAKIRLDAPFLNPGSHDDYQIHDLAPGRQRLKFRGVATGNPKSSPCASTFDASLFLEKAHGIAAQISETALWHNRRCTWLARLPKAHSGVQPEDTYQVIGPSLYSGAAGVAMFLGEIAHVTGESRFRKSAQGAMAQAIARIDELPASYCLGLHAGRLGVALAAARIGALLELDQLVEAARRLTMGAMQPPTAESQFDVMTGLAGGILSLPVLADLLEEPRCFELAAELGDALVRMATHSPCGCSWRAPDQHKRQNNLTGYSHGTAGAAHALVNLFAITGIEAYKHTAERAFAYERHWFAPDAENWPDFRFQEGQTRKTSDGHRYACTWCHGAPGIALARLPAMELCGENPYRNEAAGALRTTEKSVARWLNSGISEMGLCHGLCGNAEIVQDTINALGKRSVNDNSLVIQAAHAVTRWLESDSRPPAERVTQEGPDLMLGLAGVGRFLLRLSCPDIPSVLAVDRRTFGRSGRPESIEHDDGNAESAAA